MVVGKKILTIDDDSAFLNLVEQVLTPKGYEVFKASSGREGLRLMFDQRLDLVVICVIVNTPK